MIIYPLTTTNNQHETFENGNIRNHHHIIVTLTTSFICNLFTQQIVT